jgi:PncC family amidohydrolase
LDARVGQLELSDLVALAERVQEICLRRSLKLAAAESCTGGLVGYALTEVAGSSEYFVGGVISYSNDAKREQLGVPAATLEMHGAVSAQTAVAMAEGARQRFAADIAVAVTGIAGPGGGTDAKPVGLVYVAVADADGHSVQRHLRHGDRHVNRLESARACLELLLSRLESA